MKSSIVERQVVSSSGLANMDMACHRKPLRLAYLGSLAREKGIYEVLQGLELAKRNGTNACLLIAGSGPDYSTLKRFSENLALHKEVFFVGALFGEDKMALLRHSDVMLLPANTNDLPYAMLEGMAAGVPVIAMQRTGLIRDIIIDGVHGLFVRHRDPPGICWAITQLAANRELLTQMSSACRTHVVARYLAKRVGNRLSESSGTARAPANQAAERADISPMRIPGATPYSQPQRRFQPGIGVAV